MTNRAAINWSTSAESAVASANLQPYNSGWHYVVVVPSHSRLVNG